MSWLASFGVEALRNKPSEPKNLSWLPAGFEIKHSDLDGLRFRYVKGGSGPDLVLLHTLRTSLDIHQNMLADLAGDFTVYAIDYPGHGWSDIPDAAYAPDDFYGWVETALDKLDVKAATVAGTSIGGTIGLELAARQNPRIAKVIAINPYDYPITLSSGLKGSSFWAKVVHSAMEVPVIGETFMRLRMQWMERMILQGGLTNNAAMSEALYQEISSIGNRPGQLNGFISLVRNSQKWQQAVTNYPRIKVPVLLVYSSDDWGPQHARDKTANAIPDVKVVTVPNSGHFLPIDKPEKVVDLIRSF